MHPHHRTTEGVANFKKIAKKIAAKNMVRLVRLEEEEETRARQQPPAQPAAAADDGEDELMEEEEEEDLPSVSILMLLNRARQRTVQGMRTQLSVGDRPTIRWRWRCLRERRMVEATTLMERSRTTCISFFLASST